MTSNTNPTPIETQLLQYLQENNVLPLDGYTTKIVKKFTSDWGRFQATAELKLDSNMKQDIFDRLGLVSKGAYKTFNDVLKPGYSPTTNFCIIDIPYKDKGSQIVFSRLLKELKDVDLIKKVPASIKPKPKGKLVYIVNPYYLKCYQYQEALEIWEQL